MTTVLKAVALALAVLMVHHTEHHVELEVLAETSCSVALRCHRKVYEGGF